MTWCCNKSAQRVAGRGERERGIIHKNRQKASRISHQQDIEELN
jgi:hypothetical protein